MWKDNYLAFRIWWYLPNCLETGLEKSAASLLTPFQTHPGHPKKAQHKAEVVTPSARCVSQFSQARQARESRSHKGQLAQVYNGREKIETIIMGCYRVLGFG